MHVGLVGLGKMGGDMRTRMRAKGLEVTGYDPHLEVSDVPDMRAMVAAVPTPRVVWVMVPSGPVTDGVIVDLLAQLSVGDLIIDGGNTRFVDDLVHADLAAQRGVRFLGCGVSGGIWGAREGYGLMVGGAKADVEAAMPVFDALRPDGPRSEGFVHAGENVSAGHYAKMVHNGIEYGIMQAYAEGYELMAGRGDMIDDVPAVLKGWQRGTVVRSWLLELLVRALEQDPRLTDIEGYVEDSGEGRWTVEEALEHAVPMPVISAAVFARFVSRQEDSPSMKAVAALRKQFGGHAVRPA